MPRQAFAPILTGLVIAAGCAPMGGTGAAVPATAAAAAPVNAVFQDAEGRQVGSATATHLPHGTLLRVVLRGLEPGVHGIHVHAVGRCAPTPAPTFSSAGPHADRGSHRHGFGAPDGPHTGDLPNLVVPPGGEVTGEFVVTASRLDALLDADGASIVVHAKADDHRTDPAGDSGDRIACAVLAPAPR